jgi:hypothetical protein
MSEASKFRLYRFLRYFFVGCGWLIFVYEWIHVSYDTPRRDQLTLAYVLIFSLPLIQAGIYFWIAHNRRLSTQGRRGLATRYTSPAYSEDRLGRRLIFNDGALLSKEIVVSVEGNSKLYAAKE